MTPRTRTRRGRPRPTAPGTTTLHTTAFGATSRLRASRILATLVLAASVAACGGAGPGASGPSPATAPPTTAATLTPTASSSVAPSASASQDLSTDFAEIEARTAAIRSLLVRSPIEPHFIDETALKKMLTADFEAAQSPQRIADTELLYRGLGLFSGDQTLRDVYLEALGSQVLGFYRNADKALYVVERPAGPGTSERNIERYTFSHELTHALQDQHFDLSGLGLEQIGQGDQALGRLALVEGDASYASLLWAEQNLTIADLLAIVKVASDPAQQRQLDNLPLIVREATLFPYTEGLSFVMGLQTAGGWKAVDNAYADPPLSTEQILHPAKYRAGEKPVTVRLPTDLAGRLGSGWSLALDDTLGELQLRVLLQTANDATAATAAASDWGGDRIGLYRGPDGAWAIVLATAWDTPEAADRFQVAALAVAAGLPHARVVPGAQGPMLLAGSSASVLDELAAQLGAP